MFVQMGTEWGASYIFKLTTCIQIDSWLSHQTDNHSYARIVSSWIGMAQTAAVGASIAIMLVFMWGVLVILNNFRR